MIYYLLLSSLLLSQDHQQAFSSISVVPCQVRTLFRWWGHFFLSSWLGQKKVHGHRERYLLGCSETSKRQTPKQLDHQMFANSWTSHLILWVKLWMVYRYQLDYRLQSLNSASLDQNLFEHKLFGNKKYACKFCPIVCSRLNLQKICWIPYFLI